MERTKFTGGTATQMHHARKGVVTPEMRRVAEREQAEPEFIRDEADRITWMARAHAATLGDLSIRDWTCRHHGQMPDPLTQTALRTEARAQAVRQVLSTELYELIPTEVDDW